MKSKGVLIEDETLTAEEAEDCENEIRAEVTSLWQTDEVRLAKPTVDDEIRMGLRYFRLSMFDALPKIYAEIAASQCPLNCSNFRQVDNRSLPKATLSQHFKILREAGLIRSERKGIQMHNTTRCAELQEHFGDMLAAILTTYAAQNSRR